MAVFADPVTVPYQELTAWVSDVFLKLGIEEMPSAQAAQVLVDANLTGVDSHGVSRLPTYATLIERGVVKTRPRFSYEDRNGLIFFDADCGLGQVAGIAVADLAIEKAVDRAVTSVAIARIAHMGALGHFTERCAKAGMITFLVQNGPPVMGLQGSLHKAIGNNPLSFAAPICGKAPFRFDMATSEVAFGKIIEAARRGDDIPIGWATDKEGNLTTNPDRAMQGILLPSGGPKGIGIAMMIEFLAGSLTGMMPSTVIPEGMIMPAYFGAFLLVVNPALAIGRDAFDQHVATWMGHYLGVNPRGRYAGQYVEETRQTRRVSGVNLSQAVVEELKALGDRLSRPFPT